MAYDEHLADRVRDILVSNPGLTERKMFGGIAFMLGGHMCCGIVGDGDGSALRHEGGDDRPAEPSGSAGDERDPVLEAPPAHLQRRLPARWLVGNCGAGGGVRDRA